MSVNDYQESGCAERGIDQLPTLEIALFFLVFNNFPEGHTTLISSPRKKIKVMILLCIKKLFCIIYYLSAEALRALEFHPCMQKKIKPSPKKFIS